MARAVLRIVGDSKALRKSLDSAKDDIDRFKKQNRASRAIGSAGAGIGASTGLGALGVGLGRSLGSINAGLAVTTGSLLAFGGTIKSVYDEFRQFEKGWAEVTTLLPQLTQAATDQMSDEVREFAKNTGVHISDAIRASYQAISASIPHDELVGFLEDTRTASLAGVTDLTTAIDITTSVLNAYSMSARDAERVNDTLFTAVRWGKTTYEELAVALGKVLPLSSHLGISINQMTASVSALTAQGLSTADAVTAVRSALTAFAKDTTARDILEHLVGDITEYFRGGGDIQEAFTLIVEYAEEMGLSIQNVFGRIEGAIAATGLVGEQSAEIYKKALNIQIGEAEIAAEKMRQIDQYKFDVHQ